MGLFKIKNRISRTKVVAIVGTILPGAMTILAAIGYPLPEELVKDALTMLVFLGLYFLRAAKS